MLTTKLFYKLKSSTKQKERPIIKLGQKIADLRKKSSLSQEALAEKMNVSRQAVSKWESNQSIPDIEKIVDLSELFGVTTNYLLKNGTPSFELPGKSSEEKIEKALSAITQKKFALTSTQNYLIDSSAHEFRKKNNRRIVIGVVLCILAIIPLIMIWTLHLLPGWSWTWTVLMITFVLLSIVSYQFTFYFLRQLAFKTIAGRRKHLPKEEKSLLVNGSVIFWIVLLLVYYLIRHYVQDPNIADNVSGLIFNLALVTYLIFTLIFFKKKAK